MNCIKGTTSLCAVWKTNSRLHWKKPRINPQKTRWLLVLITPADSPLLKPLVFRKGLCPPNPHSWCEQSSPCLQEKAKWPFHCGQTPTRDLCLQPWRLRGTDKTEIAGTTCHYWLDLLSPGTLKLACGEALLPDSVSSVDCESTSTETASFQVCHQGTAARPA